LAEIITNDLPEINFASVQEKWDRVIQNYGQSENMINAFGKAYANNPFIQNTRLKQIRSMASRYTREQLEAMLLNPSENEQSLRQASWYFNNTIAPMMKLNNLYPDILSFRSYIDVIKVTNEKTFIDEYEKLASKKQALDIERTFRNITKQSMIEGKKAHREHLKRNNCIEAGDMPIKNPERPRDNLKEQIAREVYNKLRY